MRFFDSHAHYDDRRFAAEYEGGTDAALRYVHRAGVAHVMNVGSSLVSSERSVQLAERFGFVYAAVGIHPCDAQELSVSEIDRALARVEEMAGHEKVRAVGEIGFDYHYDGTDTERQRYFFESQIAIAVRLGLPVIVHSRDASGDTLDMIGSHPEVCGIMHSYSGSAEDAARLAQKGWYISFSGPVTYKNARRAKESAAIVPDEMLLIETDAPYLPPEPHRGELNTSAFLPFTCAAVAAQRGATVEETAELTYQNACRLFRIDE